MKSLNLFLLSLSILLNPWISSSQENYTIEWGPTNIPRGAINNIIGTDGNDFHILTQNRGRGRLLSGGSSDFTISRVSNYNSIEPVRLKLRGEGKPSDLEGVMDFNHSIFALSSNTSFSTKTNRLYYHFFPKFGMLGENDGVKIAEYAFRDGGNSRDIFQFDFSQDTSKIGVIYEIQGAQNDAAEFGYIVLNDSMRSLRSGSHILNYNTNQLDIVNHYVDNNGDIFVIAKEFRKRNNSATWDKYNRLFSQVKLFKVTQDSIIDLKINAGERRVHELKMMRDSTGNFLCTGFYSNSTSNAIIGAYAMTINNLTNEVTNWNVKVFDAEIINALRIDSRRYIIDSELYLLRELEQTSDGGFIGTTEVNYTEEFQRNGANGAVITDYYFNSNSILSYKINKDGIISWSTLTPKIQYSINDSGDYLSSIRYVKGNKIYYLFNDDDENYNDNYQFQNGFNINVMNANKKRNSMVVAEIDGSTGAQKRYSIGNRKTFGTVLVPYVSQRDDENGSLIIYGKTNKEKFGRIAFN